MPSSPLSALLAFVEGVALDRVSLGKACGTCECEVEFCDTNDTWPHEPCIGRQARAALRAWRERPAMRDDAELTTLIGRWCMVAPSTAAGLADAIDAWLGRTSAEGNRG